MAVSLTIRGNTFEYPTEGENPGWGGDATDWAIAVTEALGTLLGAGDILQTQALIGQDVSIPTNVNRLVFDGGTVRAANVMYQISRVSSDYPSGRIESGTLYLTYDAAATDKWLMNRIQVGDAQVNFTITNTGQIQYTAYNMSGTGYNGTITFSAKTLSV